MAAATSSPVMSSVGSMRYRGVAKTLRANVTASASRLPKTTAVGRLRATSFALDGPPTATTGAFVNSAIVAGRSWMSFPSGPASKPFGDCDDDPGNAWRVAPADSTPRARYLR